MPYMQRRPFINGSDYIEESEPSSYRSSFSNPGSLIMFFLLILLAGWVLFGNNRSPRDFGINWGGSDQVAIIGAPGTDVQVEATPRTIYQEQSTPLPALPARRSVPVATPRPIVRVTAPEATARAKDPAIVGYSWISATRVNMRVGPGVQYDLVAVLSQNQMVAILDRFELDEAGEVWSKVSIEKNGFVQEGWINRSYLSY